MKNKKMYLIIYLFLIGIIIWGTLTLIVQQWESSKIPIDGFSEHYIDISIKKRDDSQFTPEKLLPDIPDWPTSFRIQKMTDQGYSLIYLLNTALPIQLIEGRNFESKDFIEHKNVAIIDIERINQTYTIDHVRYLAVNGLEYEVIGIFEKETNDIFQNTSIFINMMAEQMQSQISLEGRYLIDGISHSNLEDIQKITDLHFNKTVFEIDARERWRMVMDTLIFPSKTIYLGTLFCILGLIYMIYMWLNSINKTIDVAIICGATAKRAIFDVLADYFIILCYGWGIPMLFFILRSHSAISIWIALILIVINMFFCHAGLIIMLRK